MTELASARKEQTQTQIKETSTRTTTRTVTTTAVIHAIRTIHSFIVSPMYHQQQQQPLIRGVAIQNCTNQDNDVKFFLNYLNSFGFQLISFTSQELCPAAGFATRLKSETKITCESPTTNKSILDQQTLHAKFVAGRRPVDTLWKLGSWECCAVDSALMGNGNQLDCCIDPAGRNVNAGILLDLDTHVMLSLDSHA
eukprot:6132242-Amphidinium_carterae.1